MGIYGRNIGSNVTNPFHGMFVGSIQVGDVHVKFLVVGVGHMGEAEKWKTLQRKVL